MSPRPAPAARRAPTSPTPRARQARAERRRRRRTPIATSQPPLQQHQPSYKPLLPGEVARRQSSHPGHALTRSGHTDYAAAVLADVHDEWQAGDRRYLSEGSMAILYPERDTDHVAELTPGG